MCVFFVLFCFGFFFSKILVSKDSLFLTHPSTSRCYCRVHAQCNTILYTLYRKWWKLVWLLFLVVVSEKTGILMFDDSLLPLYSSRRYDNWKFLLAVILSDLLCFSRVHSYRSTLICLVLLMSLGGVCWAWSTEIPRVWIALRPKRFSSGILVTM